VVAVTCTEWSAYWVASTVMFGYFAFISCTKPCTRWSSVLLPGGSLIATTLPPPPTSLAMMSAASAPPATLSLLI
jgi:hypothetical protein